MFRWSFAVAELIGVPPWLLTPLTRIFDIVSSIFIGHFHVRSRQEQIGSTMAAFPLSHNEAASCHLSLRGVWPR